LRESRYASKESRCEEDGYAVAATPNLRGQAST
jgi:hypothetical protein